MIQQLRLLLGPARLRALFLLLALTGAASLLLNALVNQYDWVRPIQSLLAVTAIMGSVLIVIGRLEPDERLRWLSILAPAFSALLLGLFVVPHLLLPLLGAALGWVVAGVLLMRGKIPMEYQQAVKHLRKSEYADAVKIMDGVIKNRPDAPRHYRFRAEILRLWGKLDRARRDYQKMVELDPQSAVAYNGLAEVLLQSGDYAQAREAGQKAYELAPDEWVAAYNLGMIEDRLGMSEAAIEHLQRALALKVPDARHRLLIHLYLARAHSRLGDSQAAQDAVNSLKRQHAGLDEWQIILASDQADTLRAVIAADIEVVQQLIEGKLDAAALGEQEARR